MLNFFVWLGRLLLSSKTVAFGLCATVFNWVIKSKIFWCFFALYGCIRASMWLYNYVVSSIVSQLNSYSAPTISGSSSLSILAYANSVVPIDEIGAAFVMLGSAYALRFGVRWLISAYKIVPFKAS